MNKMTQRAVQLIGPDKLIYNAAKEIHSPGPHQMLCRVETVGLCFSDMKLLAQFDSHVRKGPVVSGMAAEVLSQIPSYVPGEAATVPGHETVVRIDRTGPCVEKYKIGERYLVQADYRWLKTADSNAAFGYNFEGALQEYVLIDERAITDPAGRSMLVPVRDELGASAVALAEPWACVEHAYSSEERQSIKADGNMLVVCDADFETSVLKRFLERFGGPGQITTVGNPFPLTGLQVSVKRAQAVAELTDASFDDVLYFGANARGFERVFAKVGKKGLLNIICCGKKFATDVTLPVGRIHYSGIRMVGTVGDDPAESMTTIPQTSAIRPGDKINVVGAAGPMGTMHVMRNICQDAVDVSVYAGDTDPHRLAVLEKIAVPAARRNNVELVVYDASKNKPDVAFTYVVVMAPVPELAADAVKNCAAGGIINIFAGIPQDIKCKVDLDAYISNRLYLVATSGSTLEDMKTVLAKVESGDLNTNSSVAAVCGLEAAVEAIRAVENRTIAGKIMVYPPCRNLPLVALERMPAVLPQVAACLDEGLWTKKAEQMLLRKYGN